MRNPQPLRAPAESGRRRSKQAAPKERGAQHGRLPGQIEMRKLELLVQGKVAELIELALSVPSRIVSGSKAMHHGRFRVDHIRNQSLGITAFNK